MYQKAQATTASKAELYRLLNQQAAAMLRGERDWLVNLANLSALIYDVLPDLNWAGFYLWRGGQLVIGPFQGKPACARITLGKGVCGTTAEKRSTTVVPDVHKFSGHIACDSASNSEIVVPMLHGHRLIGVLDLDSPTLGRFDYADQTGLEELVRVLVNGTDWPA